MLRNVRLHGQTGINQIEGGCQPLKPCASKPGTVVGYPGRRDENAAIEIGQEELGACLGRVEADDAEVFRPHLLDAGMEQAARLADTTRRTT